MDGNYDWDNLDIGNIHLDHSENFFAIKHYNHEKLNDLENEFAKANIDEIDEILQEQHTDDKENQKISINVLTVETETHVIPKNDNSNPNAYSQDKSNDSEKSRENEYHNEDTVGTARVANLALEWSVHKVVTKCPITGKLSHKQQHLAPEAYNYQQKYERNKQEALRKEIEEIKKLREFHARPVPKFQKYHKKNENKEHFHAITIPVTPEVMRHSQEAAERRRKKIEELRQQQRPRFEHREAKVLEEKPFVPKKVVTVIESKPFNLQTENRLQERKQYNKVVQQSLEEKKKKMEEERKRMEEEHIKALRKATTFKARPNPFK